MVKRDYSWLTKRYERMVEHLNLWDGNPRLDPSLKYIYLRDFIEEMISSSGDRKDFLELAHSITDKGFIPADPIVIWKNEGNDKYYVAEGNRRIAALKLLLDPSKSPKSIKRTMIFLSKKIDHEQIKKIPVAVAPSFDEAIWYINQRHTPQSNQKKWERESHLRWISGLYERFDRDINLIREYTDISENELNQSICILKMKDRIDDIRDLLSQEEYEEAKSKSFPISTLERILNKSFVQEKMGFRFVDSNVEYKAQNESFLNAFATLIKRMLLPIGHEKRIDSRKHNTNEDIQSILDELPEIQMKNDFGDSDKPVKMPSVSPSKGPIVATPVPITKIPLKNNPNRYNIVVKEYQLETDDYRLLALFNELKRLSLNICPNIASAAIRVFLDIAIRNFMISEGYDSSICRANSTSFEKIGLKERLKYIKETSNKLNKETKGIITQLLNDDFQFSLHVLNCYVHSSKTYNINKEYMNNFWDFLFPLFDAILEIKECE